MKTQKTVKQLIESLGGQTAVAKMFGIRQQSVFGWIIRGIPASRVLSLVILSHGQFQPHHLRPDLYSNDAMELLRKS